MQTRGQWEARRRAREDRFFDFESMRATFLQHDQNVANDTGAAVRSDINNALAALFSNSSGATAPSTTVAYQWWADTTTGLLKIRNAANSAWVTVGTLASTNLGLASLAGAAFTGSVYIGDTANASSTLGLTINQAGNDDEILALKSSDVAHALTGVTEADTFGTFKKAAPATGGLAISGFQETGADSSGVVLSGYVTSNVDTTKTAAGAGAVRIIGIQNSGGSAGGIVANGNILTIENNGSTRVIFDAEGDSYQDGTGWNAFDHVPDVAVCDAVDKTLDARIRDPLREATAEWLSENERMLEDLRIVYFNRDTDGRPFVNKSRLLMLHNGAIRQQQRAIETVVSDVQGIMAALPRLEQLERRLGII